MIEPGRLPESDKENNHTFRNEGRPAGRCFPAVLIAVVLTVAGGALQAQSGAPSAKPSAVDASKPRTRSVATFSQVARRAAAARESSRLEEASGLYQQALGMRDSWTEGWWYLGTIYYELDRYAEARDALRRLVSLKPDGGAGWALLGLCEFELREYERALANLQRGRSLGLGGNAELIAVTRYRTALLLTRSEQSELALEILAAFAREQEESPTLVEALGLAVLRMPLLPSELPGDKRELVLRAGRAFFFTVKRRLSDAEREYETLVARYPETSNVHYAYGVYLLHADPDSALEEFRREIQVSPSHVPARLQIAFEYIKQGRYADGLAYAEQAVELAPRSFPARNALGRILLELGQTERAIRELEVGVKLGPGSAEMHFALGRAYARVGRKEDAARVRAEFLRLDKIRRSRREPARSAGTAEPPRDERAPM